MIPIKFRESYSEQFFIVVVQRFLKDLEAALQRCSLEDVVKICSKFTEEHPCQSHFIQIALWHGCSPVNLLHIFRTPFPKNTSGGLLLKISRKMFVVKFLFQTSFYP